MTYIDQDRQAILVLGKPRLRCNDVEEEAIFGGAGICADDGITLGDGSHRGIVVERLAVEIGFRELASYERPISGRLRAHAPNVPVVDVALPSGRRNWFTKAEMSRGRRCVADVREVVIATSLLDVSQLLIAGIRVI